jgi:hypothetical protein
MDRRSTPQMDMSFLSVLQVQMLLFALKGSSFSDTNTPAKHTLKIELQKSHITTKHFRMPSTRAHATIAFQCFLTGLLD